MTNRQILEALREIQERVDALVRELTPKPRRRRPTVKDTFDMAVNRRAGEKE